MNTGMSFGVEATPGNAAPLSENPPMNKMLGRIRLHSGRSENGDATFARIAGAHQLSSRDPSYDLAVSLTTLAANWYRLGPRSILWWGNEPSKFDFHSGSALRDFTDFLTHDPQQQLARLTGTWGMVVADDAAGWVLLAVDRAAQRPVCFRTEAGSLIFGFGANEVATSGDAGSSLRTQAIYDYLRGHVIPAPETIFTDVSRLQPGEYVKVAHRATTRSFYWKPSYAPAQGPRPSISRARDRLLSLLEDAVRDGLGPGKTGAFLSGGTDSSTIAGMLGIVTKEPANTYSIGFDAPGFDETAYARIAARHFNTNHHEHYVTPDDLVQSIPEVACAYDQPFGNSSALAAYYCARLAAGDGVKRMLGGDGGDELFGGNTRYAKQKLFDVYHRIPRIVDRTLVEAVLVRPAITGQLPLVSKLRSYVVQARIAMPQRLHTYNLIGRLGPSEMFTPGFLAEVDQAEPVTREATWYARCLDSEVVNQMLQYDWKYTLADNDIPKVVTTCEMNGLQVAFPMLSEPLVEFANGLPVSWKVAGGKLRPFFKSTLSSFLPREILEKKKHGFGLPFGHWLVEHRALFRLATRSLDSFRERGVIQSTFLDGFLGKRLHEHAGYYGELVWTMMMLELWLQKYSPDYRRSV